MIFGFAKDRPRPPLWAAFVPLLVGLSVYGWFWYGESQALKSDVQKYFAPKSLEMGGFPYRVSAQVAPAQIARTQGEIYWHFTASQLEVNRQPWRRSLSVAQGTDPKMEVVADLWPDASLAVEGKRFLGSLHAENHVVQRLSAVFDQAIVRLPFLPLPLASPSFEVHMRETPQRKPLSNSSPTAPDQAQLRFLGPVQIDPRAEAVDLESDIGITDDAPLKNISQWRKGGTIELRSLHLRDSKGFVFFTMKATLAPLPDGRMAIAGTYETSCPRTIAALLIGMPSPAEYRTRCPQKYALNGFAGGKLDVAPVVEGFTGGPARNREPACPVLHR